MFQLTIEIGPSAGASFTVENRATVGRLKSNEIPIKDGSVSREHARLLVQGNRLLVRDLESANGTFVNEQKIQSGEVHHGDTLRIGKIVLRVTRTGAEAGSPPPPAGDAPPAPSASPRTSSSPPRRPTAGGAPGAGFDIRERKKILQYSAHARSPRDGSLLTTDLDQRSGLFKLVVVACLIIFSILVIVFSGRIVDWLIPSTQPTAVEDQGGDELPD
jgi:hypothetical protein